MGESTTPSPSKPFKIAIVGGGLGGLCLALTLIHHNVPFHIYEAAPSFGEIGAGVMFGPNAVRALGLISPSTISAFKDHATTHTDPSLHRIFLNMRMGMPGRSSANTLKSGDLVIALDAKDEWHWPGMPTMNTLHRARFLEALIKFIPEGVASFKKQLVDLEPISEGGVRLHFGDGTSAEADAVVGYDGIKSKTRDALLHLQGKPLLQASDSGLFAYRDLMAIEMAEEILGAELARNGNLWKGYGGYLVMYPVEHGRLYNLIFMRRNHPDMQNSLEQLIVPATKEDAFRDFADWDPRILKLLEKFKSYNRWLLFNLNHEEKYSWKRICIAGDAAHASTPHLGSGAAMAIEDAYILGNLIGEAKSAEQLESAFRAFDEVRRPRTQRLVAWSKRTGYVHSFLEPPVGICIGDDVEKNRLDAREAFYWVWDFKLEDQLKEAKKLLAPDAN